MDTSRPKPFKNHCLWLVVETVLFGFAVAMMIPPVPSEIGQRYSSTSSLIIGGGAFAAFLGIKIWRREESWITAIIKTVFYLIAVALIYKRVFM